MRSASSLAILTSMLDARESVLSNADVTDNKYEPAMLDARKASYRCNRVAQPGLWGARRPTAEKSLHS